MTAPLSVPQAARATRLWQDLWFQPVPPHLYAVLRVAFGLSGCAILISLADFAAFWDLDGFVATERGWSTLKGAALAYGLGRPFPPRDARRLPGLPRPVPHRSIRQRRTERLTSFRRIDYSFVVHPPNRSCRQPRRRASYLFAITRFVLTVQAVGLPVPFLPFPKLG